jgi:protein-L-isoaspartate(D-aspartate) O-methyltransferase
MSVPDQAKIRLIMHLRQAGIKDTNVLSAIEKTSREVFVPPSFHDQAYEDTALPIGLGQTISQPFIVAYMTEVLELDPRMTVLEIGTGSGYQTAVLAKLCRRVYTIERHKPLLELAQRHFETFKLRNVTAMAGDGTRGWPGSNEFDRIIVTAAAAEPPLALLDQLKVGGIMVIPVGDQGKPQVLRRYKRESEDIYAKQDMLPVRFVPLLPDVPRSSAYSRQDLEEMTA